MTTTITGATGVNQITDDAITDAKLPAGSVLQVIHTQNPDSPMIATTSASFVASGIQASITPTKVGNRILVEFVSTMATFVSAGNIRVIIYVGGSAWPSSSSYHAGFRNNGLTGEQYSPIIFCGELTASNLNAIAIEPYFRSGSSGVQARIAHSDASYSLKLTEISA